MQPLMAVCHHLRLLLMTRQKTHPSELELVNSAWEAFKNESKNIGDLDMEALGWKSTSTLSQETGRTESSINHACLRQVRAGKMEMQKLAITRDGVRRNVNFYRPIISDLT
jgi:hypothetical protein